MEIDTRFPTKLDAITDAPKPLRSALEKRLRSDKRIRLLMHAPSFWTGKEKSLATLLAVTDKGWLAASDCEQSGTSVSASIFSETLFLELTSNSSFRSIQKLLCDVWDILLCNCKLNCLKKYQNAEVRLNL